MFILTLLVFTFIACNKTTNDKFIPGKSNATERLKMALSDTPQHNLVDNRIVIIKDSLTAISIVEPILFGIYGKDNIINQRPYESYFIDNFWIISGTLQKEYLGGTFLIIMDSRDCRLVKITHGK